MKSSHWGGHWRFGGLDSSRVEVFLQEGIQLFLFRGRERVDFAAFRRGVSDKLYCTILWFGFRQFVKGVLRKDGSEVTEVWWNMLVTVHQHRVLLETFRKVLGNCRDCSNVFHLREESGGPNSVTLFQRFIRKHIVFCLGRVHGFRGGFVVVVFISVLHKGWEGASLTGINLSDTLFRRVLFLFLFSLTTRAAAQEALGHLDSPGTEIYLWVVLVEPGETEDHALLSKAGDC